MVRSSFQTNDRTGTFKCARSQCKTCPFIHNVEQLSGPTRSIKISDHFKCTSTNVIYCTTCTYCETGRRLGDRFREHLRDVERNDKDASKSVARHLALSAFYSINLFCFLVTIFPPMVLLHFLHINPHTVNNSSNRSDEGLTLETSAFKLFTVANLRYQPS